MRHLDSLVGLSDVQRARVRRSAALGLVLIAAATAALGVTRLGRATIDQALTVAGHADPGWLFAAFLAFGAALLCSAAAWRVGLRTCSGSAGATQIASRYAVGSLTNSVTPAHLGAAVRVALFSRTLPGEDPVWRTCGVGAAVSAARSLAFAAVVVAAAAVGRVPLWPAVAVALAVGGAVAVAMRASTRVAGHVASLLQTFRAPRAALDMLGWVACATGARLAAAIAVVLALGIPHQFAVAIVLVAAIGLAGIFPLTPGNIGAGAGAATLALHGTGVGAGVGLALGMTFQAVETSTSLLLGLAGSAVLAAPGTRLRRWALAGVAVGALAVAATLGVASVDLV